MSLLTSNNSATGTHANGRIVLHPTNELVPSRYRQSFVIPSRHLNPGHISLARTDVDRCRLCGSKTARLINVRKNKWKCSTCGETYQMK